MAVSLPYLPSNKNVSLLFEKIASAKIPDTFSHNFLQTTIGLKGSNDRALIALLRNFGFIDQSSAPTSYYRRLKGDESKLVIADGIRRAYQPLFDADQLANRLSGDKLKSLVSQVAGTDDQMTARIASTFTAISKLGDFDAQRPPPTDKQDEEDLDSGQHLVDPNPLARNQVKSTGLRTEFHYNIQVHLPANGTEEVYLNIFNALRKTFQ